MPLWKCPRCGAFIPYQDYDLVARPKDKTPYHCGACGLHLVVDKKTDELIAAPPEGSPPPGKPRRKRR